MRSLHAAVPVGGSGGGGHIGGGEVRAFWPRLKRDPPLFADDEGINGVGKKKNIIGGMEKKNFLFNFVHILIYTRSPPRRVHYAPVHSARIIRACVQHTYIII